MQQTKSHNLPLDFYLSNEELKLRHEMCKNTPLAYLFFPSETEIVDFNPKKLKKLEKWKNLTEIKMKS